MKSILFILSIIVAGFITSWFFPWWSIAIVCFVVAFLFNKSPGVSYALAFTAVGLLWGGYAAYLNVMNGGVLFAKMQGLLLEFLKADSGFMKGVVNVIMWGGLGSLVGGFGALTGVYARRIIHNEK
jgi:hypothetical protein